MAVCEIFQFNLTDFQYRMQLTLRFRCVIGYGHFGGGGHGGYGGYGSPYIAIGGKYSIEAICTKVNIDLMAYSFAGYGLNWQGGHGGYGGYGGHFPQGGGYGHHAHHG